MSIESKLNYLLGTKNEIRSAIQEKGVSVPSDTTFRQYADKIRAIETGSTTPPEIEINLQEKTVEPTGSQFEVTPDASYDGLSKVIVEGAFNLKPENIAYGVTIYGVTGTMVPPANMTNVPSYYQEYLEHAKTLYTGDYKNLMILESDTAIAFGFLLDAFNVKSFNEESTEFTAENWVYVAYNKQTNQWKVEDWTNATSNGNSYIKNIRYSDAYIYYLTRLLYPFIVNEETEDLMPNDVFKVKINVTSTTTSYDLRGSGLFTIDWGDSSDLVNVSSSDYDTVVIKSHKYSTKGEYVITIQGYLKRINDSNSTNRSSIFTNAIEILTPLPAGLVSCYYLFEKNAVIESIPSDLFSKCKIVRLDGTFAQCTKLKTIPPGLFVSRPFTTMYRVFYGCAGLTSIPADLFVNAYFLKSTTSMFEGCSKLVSIPTYLFSGAANLEDINNMFLGCSGLYTIPSNLLSECENLLNASGLFKKCSGIESIPDNFFSACEKLINVSSCFEECTRLTDVPGNIFEGCEKITTVDGLFYLCTGIISIGEGLLYDMPNLTSVYKTFAMCKIASISNIFNENTFAVSNVREIFRNCGSLLEVPDDFFDFFENVTNAIQAFNSCSGYTGSLPELWTKENFANATHTSTFTGCTKASNYDDVPDDWK